MIDFKEELSKFKPILEIDELEENLEDGGVKDMMDLLEKLTDNK